MAADTQEYAHIFGKEKIEAASAASIFIVVLLLCSSQKELGDLFGDSRDECQTQHQAPLSPAQEVRIEDGLQEWHSTYDQQQGNGKPNCILHVAVGK